jgi:PPK2 family polyphosphate:nucleotide phosphotransferase
VADEVTAEHRHAALRTLVRRLRIQPGAAVSVSRDFDPAETGGFHGAGDAAAELRLGTELLAEYQERLAAQRTDALLVVLQGLDASGKDSTIKHVMSGVNPAGVRVHSFKVPSEQELAHDFLWRHVRALPERGAIGIFNRSHYEEVLSVRVHPEHLLRQRLPPEAVGEGLWKRRFEEINDWERHLVHSGVHVVKLMLNVSREEQRRRFLRRIEDPHREWKFSSADVAERRHWDEYQRAYSAMLSHTSTSWAPWHVLPADHKWFLRLAAAAAIVDELLRIDPGYPEPGPEERAALQAARAELDAEAAGA